MRLAVQLVGGQHQTLRLKLLLVEFLLLLRPLLQLLPLLLQAKTHLAAEEAGG